MKFKRTERIGAIVKILSDNPNKIFTLSHFTNQFNAAKSTISEDLLVVKNVFEKLELGKVITISGAAGGVKYIPKTSKAENEEFLLDLCQKISDPSRILSGGFLYLIDLIYNPTIVSKIGKIMASNIDYAEADYVVTMETKGIPMALMTAKAMNLPLVIIRKDIKVSEGPTLSMTYVSGNTSKVESMSLPRKALKPDSKVIIIDDFMRGGGTIKGMIDLMTEFGAEVVGTGVFISTTQPEEKMVKNYISLIELDVQGDKISVQPNLKTFKDEYKNEDHEENYDLEDVLEELKGAAEGFKTIVEFLAHVENVKEEIEKSKVVQDGVILSTIHGVKGMEFKNVFIIDCNEETIPHKSSMEDNLEEERRLFYVAITRAIKNLYVFSPKTIRGKFSDMSRFILESGLEEESSVVDYGIKTGDSVYHRQYGDGKVKSIEGDKITLDFKEEILRTFSLRVLMENNLIILIK